MSQTQIAAIILAAGSSSRMGCAKQLLGYKSRRLVVHVAEVAMGSRCRPVAVVLGSHAEEIRPHLVALPIEIIENRDWQTGMGSSISVGIREVQTAFPAIEAAVFLLADQPLISSELVDQMIDAYIASPTIVACSYARSFGPPVLFDRQFFPELLGLPPAQGAKAIIRQHHRVATFVPFPEGEPDIDTPDDYAGLK